VKHNHLDDMVEIVLTKPDNFLILKETLTRIGVHNKENTRLFQTCHILCKKKRYYLVHFKELFLLDGRPSNMTVTDVARRNSIINYLLERKFFTLLDGETRLEPHLPRNGKNDDFTIIPYDEKSKWELVPKYVIGNPANKTAKKKPTKPAVLAVV
jgi:hypothetical protein